MMLKKNICSFIRGGLAIISALVLAACPGLNMDEADEALSLDGAIAGASASLTDTLTLTFGFAPVLEAALVAALLGHEFFLMPDEVKDYRAGDTAQIDALSTHFFTVGGELENAEACEVYIVRNGRRFGRGLALTPNTDRRWLEARFRFVDDSPLIVVGNRKGGFYCTFTDGNYADGPPAEVIPLDNPAGIRAGSFSRAKFRVRYRGLPLADAEISATYDYYDYKTANAYA